MLRNKFLNIVRNRFGSGSRYKELPQALLRLYEQRIALSVIVMIAAIIATIVLKNIRCLLFILISAYLIYLNLSTAKNYFDGHIKEKYMVCTKINKNYIRDSVQVLFIPIDEGDMSMEFVLPGRRQAKRLFIGGTYILYYYEDAPSRIITFTAAPISQ